MTSTYHAVRAVASAIVVAAIVLALALDDDMPTATNIFYAIAGVSLVLSVVRSLEALRKLEDEDCPKRHR